MPEHETPRFVTCGRCGWMHFATPRATVEADVADFNRYFDGLDIGTKLNYRFLSPEETIEFRSMSPGEQHAFLEGAKSSVEQYLHCFRCGAPCTEMRAAREEDCPAGATIQPILQDP